MRGILTEVRHAVRLLWRDRGFTAVALITLGLGIGASTAMFSVLDRLLIRALPYPAADRLVRITADQDGQQARDVGLDIPTLFDLADRGDVFAEVSGLYPINVNLTGSDEPERIEAQLVSVSYFRALGIGPQIGRTFDASDYHPGISEVAVISDGLWTRRFGRSDSVIGRKIRLDNDLFTIIGVMPPTFHHPGRGIAGEAEIWAPSGYRSTPFRTPTRGINTLAGALVRLRGDVPLATAQANVDRLAADLLRDNQDAYPGRLGWRLRLVPLQDDLVGGLRPALTVVMGAVALVLLMGCANLANLLLVRGDARAREMTVRLAIGATRLRLLRQSLMESGLIALAGACVGLIIASWALDILLTVSPVDLTSLGSVSIDWRAAAFATLVALACTIIFGLAPALRGARVSLAAAGRGRVTGDTPAGRRTRDVLVMLQSAVAVLLVIGALLIVGSVGALMRVDAGFDPGGVIAARFWMPQPNDPATGPYFRHEQRLPFYRRLLERVRALPGVDAAGLSTVLPLVDRRALLSMLIEGRPIESVDTVAAQQALVGPGYMETMRIGLVNGRYFADGDDERVAGVAMVSQTFARKFFGADDPVGHRIRPGGRQSTAPWLTVIGVVRDVRSDGLDREPPPQLYRSMLQASSLQFGLVVRGRVDGPTLSRDIAREVAGVDPDMPVYGVRPYDDIVARSIGQRRLAMQLLSVFAAAAVLLSAVGLYGVMSYFVGLRQKELGIRLAVGASPRDLGRLVLSRGAWLSLSGVGIGLIAAIGLSDLVSGLLFQITPLDRQTYVVSTMLLVSVALLACWLPARRAARLDPVRTLRAE
jgi:predicted permease